MVSDVTCPDLNGIGNLKWGRLWPSFLGTRKEGVGICRVIISRTYIRDSFIEFVAAAAE